jgi:ABC-2 type transport system permease protein
MKRPRINIRRFIAILRKEVIQIKRDRVSLAIPIVMPVMLMLLFGYAVNTEVEHIATAVFDMSATQESRAYVESFKSSNFFDVVSYAGSEAELKELIESGDVKAALTIPPDFAREVKAGRIPECELQIDGSDPTTARTAMSSGLLINEMVSLKLREDFAKNAGTALSSMPAVTLATRVLYNPNLESRRFTIPGLVALIMQNITVMLTAFSLVREKERGTIEQLIVTPIRSSELIVGKLIPYIVIGYAGFLFSLGLCIFWFGIWPAGNIWLLLLLGALFVIASLMIGMLISTVAKNQLQAMLAMVVIMLPSILLSGFIFPREAMPPVIAQLGLLFPITYFLDIIRGIVLKGVGADMMINQILLLTGCCAVLFSITIVRFRKSLD